MKKLLFAILLLSGLFAASRAFADDDADAGFPTIHLLKLEGNKTIPSDLLQKRMTIEQGKPLRKEQLKYSTSMIASLYRDKGFYQVGVSTALAVLPENNVDLTIAIDEGDLFHIGQVTLTGNHIVEKKIILRNLGINTGDLFSQSQIFEGNRQLYMTGYFDSIDIAYSTATAHTVDVVIRVKERATKFVKGSVGYGTQTKERVTLGFEDLNFLGNARKLDVTGTYSGFLTNPAHYETKILQTSLTQPNLFGSRYEGQSNVQQEWDRREAYDSRATSWVSSVGRRYSRKLTASMRYRYSGTQVTRESADATTPGFTNITAVGPTFTFDDTNDPFLPTIGWRILGTYEEGIRFFAGDVRFHKLEARAGRFDKITGGWVLFEGLQGGEIRPDSASDRDIIPIYERYFIGGANTVRGYSERELGLRDASGAPTGGNAFLVMNLEARHKLYKQLWGVMFLDAGQLYVTPPGHVWADFELHHLDDLRYASGCGLRVNSPIGAIRLEFGYKLNPSGGTGFLDRAGLHFSIGETF